MTKRNLLLVSLFLVFGLATMATTALAGTQWVTGSSALNVRAEGLAEEVGIYTFTLNASGSVASGQYFSVTYPASLPVVANSQYIQCTGPDFPNVDCSPILTATLVGQTVNITVTNSTNPTSFKNTSDELIVTVRVDATKATCGPTAIDATGATHNPVSGPNSLSLSASSVTSLPVATVMCTPNLSFKIAPRDWEVGANGLAGQVLSCIGTKDVGPYDNSFCVNVDEEFANALTSLSYETASDPDATNGTDFTITLLDVPTGVTVGDPTVTYCSSLAPKDKDYCGALGGNGIPVGYVAGLTVTAGELACTADTPAPTPPTQTCTITYTVDTEDGGYAENMDICFRFWSHGPLPTGYVEIYADVAKGPVNDATDTYIPSFSGVSELPLPGLSVVDFSDCQTNLLFPYINAYQGPGYAPFSHFGTGIDIANTTWDPWNATFDTGNLYPDEHKGSAVPQSGSCTFYFYPAGETATQVFTTPTISAGGSYAFDVATAAPKFAANTGYAIAVCGFQNAYGFAEIYDNFGAAVGYNTPGATLGYLAYIIPDPAFYHRSPAGDALGEESIAPINLNKLWQKLFMYGSPYYSTGP